MPYRLVQLGGGLPIWFQAACIIGDVLWIVAYILIIVRSFKDRTYGVPMLCIALNFTWEFMYAVQFPNPNNITAMLRWAWLLTDVVIVYQLFRYGRDGQNIPLIKQYFYPICVVMFVFAYIGQLTFHYSFGDTLGGVDAYMINLLMSMLFVTMYFGRPNGAGLSRGAAWAKMLGTGVLSVASCFVFTNWLQSSFLVFLFATIFIFDVIYIALLYRPQAAAAERPKDSGMLAAA